VGFPSSSSKKHGQPSLSSLAVEGLGPEIRAVPWGKESRLSLHLAESPS
jgi:hypothetical protein